MCGASLVAFAVAATVLKPEHKAEEEYHAEPADCEAA
jgi:hypothetical protein